MDFFKVNERAEKIRAYKRVFESEDGKLILKDMMKACHFFTSTMDAEPHEMAHKEGERSVLLRILRTVNLSPEEIEKYYENTK